MCEVLCTGDGYEVKKEALLLSVCLQFIGNNNIKMVTSSRGIPSVLLIILANQLAKYNTRNVCWQIILGNQSRQEIRRNL